ncbi:hypothetical protein CBS101457_001979 [Exobasidium rhododendri]|nr:hypothetical protein CBS101457_001979 [Exobasidium rhododendri]
MTSQLPRMALGQACKRCSVSLPASLRTISTSIHRQANYRRFGEPASISSNNAVSGIPIQQLIQLARGGGSRGGKKGGGGGYKKGNRSGAIIGVVLALGGTYYFFHLEKVPSTGRWRFIDVNNQQEKQMGEESFNQVLEENRGKLLPSNDKRVKFVHSVAERIVAAAQRSDHPSDHLDFGSMNDGIKVGNSRSMQQRPHSDGSVEWEVFVINSDEKNAFVLPNGKIFVYSGILPVCEDQDGLATVLGHEIAHQIARHSAEKASGFKVLMFGATLLQMIGLDSGLSSFAMNLLLSLPNSRKVEMEADQIGLQLMSMACFDPTKAPPFWQRMEDSEGGGGGQIAQAAMAVLSTHPLSHKRMESMKKWLPQAIETRQESGCPNEAVVQSFRSTAKAANPF